MNLLAKRIGSMLSARGMLILEALIARPPGDRTMMDEIVLYDRRIRVETEEKLTLVQVPSFTTQKPLRFASPHSSDRARE